MGFSIHALVQIARLYANYTSHSELNLRRVSVQQQNGYHDCGLFSIANATEICMGHKPEEACFDQSKMRKHLFSCLSKEQMQPFPRISSVQESVPRPKSGILNVRLYCICKLPAEYDSNMKSVIFASSGFIAPVSKLATPSNLQNTGNVQSAVAKPNTT